MNRKMTDAERKLQSARSKAAWAAGKFDNRKKMVHCRAWSKTEDAALGELGGTMPLPGLAAKLNERFGLERTQAAYRIRAKRIGVSLWSRALSLGDVERLMGLDHRPIVRCWIEPGHLRASRWSGRGPNAGWWIEPSDLERFIRTCGWAYDWTKLPTGRWRSLAEVANRADPWLHYDQVAAYVGIASGNLDKWRRRGLVPHRFRPKSGSAGYVMVRARDLPGIKAAIEAAQLQAREQARQSARQRFRTGPRDERGRILGREVAA